MLHICIVCIITDKESIEETESLSCSILTDTEDDLNEVTNIILALLFELTVTIQQDLIESETKDDTVEHGKRTTDTPPAANIQASSKLKIPLDLIISTCT